MKKIIYFCLSLVIFFTFSANVMAEGIQCEYSQGDAYNLTLTVTEDNVVMSITNSSSSITRVIPMFLSSDLKENNKIVMPNDLYIYSKNGTSLINNFDLYVSLKIGEEEVVAKKLGVETSKITRTRIVKHENCKTVNTPVTFLPTTSTTNKITSTTNANNTETNQSTDCLLGPTVTKDLYGALKILQILAPILMIAFSSYEAIKAVTKGDVSADMKKVAQRFGKRMIYTILLFFLPILIDQAMQMLNVWGYGGSCRFVVDTPSTTKPTTTKPTGSCETLSPNSCALRSDCEVYTNDGGPKCRRTCESLALDTCTKRDDCIIETANGGPKCQRK